jgi:hypothetical protein
LHRYLRLANRRHAPVRAEASAKNPGTHLNRLRKGERKRLFTV